MRGHVRKRGKGWVVVTDIGRDESGKRQQRWHSGYGTRKEAEAALAEILGKLGRGEYVAETKLTFGEFLRDRWLPHLDSQADLGNLRPTTVGFYSQLVQAHVLPRLGAVRLRSLDPPTLNRFYGELIRNGRRVRPGQPPAGLSATTVHSVHVTIGKALGDAVRWGLLARNVATLADPPGPARTERVIWGAEDVVTFLATTRDSRLYPAWLLAVTTGLRRGEIAGLRWSEVDLDNARLTVSGARVSVRYKVVDSGPKTSRSRRTIAIAPVVVEALRAQRERQRQEQQAWGPAWAATGLVFTREDGSAYHPEYLTFAFQSAAKKAGLPSIAFHALRHGHATEGLRAGVDLVTMSRRLGHSSIQVTGDIYAHVVDELDRKAAELTARLAGGPGVEQVTTGDIV